MRCAFVVLVACSHAPADVPGDAPLDAPPLGPREGVVSLLTDATHGSSWAGFDRREEVCATDATIGPCRVRTRCNTSTSPWFSAGTITFDHALIPDALVPVDHAYAGVQASHPAFVAGETATATATGDEVPAFTLSAIAPAQATITSPFDLATIDGSVDLAVTWTGQPVGELVFYASEGIDADITLRECRLPAAPGAGVLPASALVPGDGWEVYSVSSVALQVGAWPVRFVMSIAASLPSQ